MGQEGGRLRLEQEEYSTLAVAGPALESLVGLAACAGRAEEGRCWLAALAEGGVSAAQWSAGGSAMKKQEAGSLDRQLSALSWH